MNVRTTDGLVHAYPAQASFSCATAWETMPEEQRVWGNISVFKTDEPVTCLECLANEPQPITD